MNSLRSIFTNKPTTQEPSKEALSGTASNDPGSRQSVKSTGSTRSRLSSFLKGIAVGSNCEMEEDELDWGGWAQRHMGKPYGGVLSIPGGNHKDSTHITRVEIPYKNKPSEGRRFLGIIYLDAEGKVTRFDPKESIGEPCKMKRSKE